MKKSVRVRNQLLIVLSFFTLAGVAIAGVSLYYFNKIHDIYQISSSAHSLYSTYINTLMAEQKFINLETSKTDYFKSGKSEYLDQFHSSLSSTRAQLSALKYKPAYREFEIDHMLQNLSNELSKYETLFSFTLEKIRRKGFKDFGTEGKMRAYVHELERHSKQIGLANVLMLRRHEKDFLLRNDDAYIKKLTEKVSAIKSRIWRNDNLSNAQKDTLIMLLQNYQYSFLELVTVTKEIGHKNEEGMSEMLASVNTNIQESFDTIFHSIVRKEQLLVSDIQKMFLIIIINIVVVCLFTIALYTWKFPAAVSIGRKEEPQSSMPEKRQPVLPRKVFSAGRPV